MFNLDIIMPAGSLTSDDQVCLRGKYEIGICMLNDVKHPTLDIYLSTMMSQSYKHILITGFTWTTIINISCYSAFIGSLLFC